MTSEPLVSVILPTHNRASLLGRAIESVLRQTHRHLELIVVDDASTDDTPTVVASFTDPRLRYIRLTQNRRAAAARNIGIREARGELLAFQDDDDEWLERKLERQVAALSSAPPEVGLGICSFQRVDGKGTREIGRRNLRTIDFEHSPYGSHDFSLISTPNWLLRRSVLDQAGLFDERLKSIDDWELAFRILQVCRFEHLDEALWIQHRERAPGAGMALNTRLVVQDYQLLLEKYGSRWKPRVLARFCYQAGRLELEGHGADHLRAAIPWFQRTVRYNPLHLRAWLMLWLSALGPRALGAIVTSSRGLRALFWKSHG